MAARAYRFLLLLLPASFRNEYGEEMAADFLRQRRDTGALGRMLLWLEALPDILLAAAREHGAVLRQDLRYAYRAFRRSPGYPLTAIVIVALGVGANTAIFTVVDHALLRPLPFHEPGRLVQLWESAPSKGYDEVEPAPANYDDWVRQNRVFSGMAAYSETARNLTGSGLPQRLAGAQVTSNLFPVLGTSAARGRVLLPEEDGNEGPAVVVLSDGFWRRRLGGDPQVVGRTLQLDGEPHEVVGVMPPTFHFPRARVDFWVPLRMSPGDRTDRSNHFTRVVARLKDGVTAEQASAEMNLIAERIAAEHPETNEGSTVLMRSLRDESSRQSRQALILLSLAAAGVLLIGCANLANLLFARAGERRKELGVRAALGAGTERLVRQILTENLVLAVAGGLLGIAVAHAMLPILAHLVPANLPIAYSLSIDARVLAFGVLMSVVTGVAFAVLPARRLSREATRDFLDDGGRDGIGGRRGRLRSALVVAEVAVSVVLLIGAGLLVQALSRVSSVDPGFRTEDVLTLRTSLPLPRYPEIDDRERFYDRVLSEVRALPDVKGAGYTGFLPFVMRGILWPVGIDGDPAGPDDRMPIAVFREVTEGYLETMGIELLRGRHFGSQDTLDSPKSAIVSESFAKRFWPDQDPVGREFEFKVAWMPDRWTVAGVVPDIRARGLERRPLPQVYVLHRQMTVASFHAPRDLAIRFDGDVRTLIPEVRRIVHETDPEQPISSVRTLSDLFAGETADRRHQLRLLGAFTLLAFVMSALGIYGVLSFLVSQRTQEIGVRMALGARVRDVMRMILGQGLTLSAIGLAIGLGGGLALGATMRHLLFGVEPFDPTVLAASAGLCLVASLVACLLPALRAARVDPMQAVRNE